MGENNGLRLLHIGSGGIYLDGFINSDKVNEWKGKRHKIDDLIDLGKPWPYKNESVDGVVSMHVLQQLTPRELFLNALPEAYRVLKKGGVMRFGVPSVEIMNRSLAYLLGWNNINLLSEDILRRVLVDRIGFSLFKKQDYHESFLPALTVADNRKDRGTIYYECLK